MDFDLIDLFWLGKILFKVTKTIKHFFMILFQHGYFLKNEGTVKKLQRSKHSDG